VLDSEDIDGAFEGVPELAHRLAGSEQVRRCVVKQWFRYGFARAETSDDACSLDQLSATFEGAGHDIRALLIALTQTDAFRYRPRVATPGGAE
jgi:hypothetical protein